MDYKIEVPLYSKPKRKFGEFITSLGTPIAYPCYAIFFENTLYIARTLPNGNTACSLCEFPKEKLDCVKDKICNFASIFSFANSLANWSKEVKIKIELNDISKEDKFEFNKDIISILQVTITCKDPDSNNKLINFLESIGLTIRID